MFKGKNTLHNEDTWCVIPVFNNKGTIMAVARDCRERIKHVLVVDDGSTDADIPKMFENTAIEVVRHPKNLGKGMAILTALEYVRRVGGRFIITVDADGQHIAGDIYKFMPLLSEDAIVIGSRNFKDGLIPFGSRFGRKFANFWLRIETGVHMDDCQSGFRGYPVDKILKLKLKGSYYDFEAEVLAKAVWAGFELKTVNISVWYPHKSERVSNFRPFMDNLRLTIMHTRLVIRRLMPVPYKKLATKKIKGKYPNIVRHPLQLIKSQLLENSTPSGLAASAFTGIFLGTLPLLFAHTVIIIYVTVRLHMNKVMAVSIQNLCIPPFVPFLCIEVGYYFRHGEWLKDLSRETMLLQIGERLYEWLLGSIIVAPILAFISGVIVFFLARILRRRGILNGSNRAAE